MSWTLFSPELTGLGAVGAPGPLAPHSGQLFSKEEGVMGRREEEVRLSKSWHLYPPWAKPIRRGGAFSRGPPAG